MDEAQGACWPPDNSQLSSLPDRDISYSVPSPVEFVSVVSDSSLDVVVQQMQTEAQTIKRKKHSKKHLKKSKEASQDSIIPLGQTQKSSVKDDSEITQITDSFASPPVTTLQTLNTPAYVPSNRQLYNLSDKGPFVVHVQKTDSLSTSVNTYLHPVNFGRFLRQNNFINIVDGSLQRIGRNRVSLSFIDAHSANDFIASEVVKSKGYKTFIPAFGTTRLGIVKGVPVEWTEEEVLENISLPLHSCPIIKVRRLNYKVVVDGTPVYKPSQSCVLSFDGQILPPRVFLCYNSLSVEKYYYPTIQCFQCCRFGHTKNNCRSKPRCFKCGDAHTGDSCDAEEGTFSCLFCSGFHFSTNRCCPEYNRQKNIKVTMTEKSISYAEASKLHSPTRGKSYSDVTKTSYANISPGPLFSHNKSPSQSSSYKKTVFLKPKPPPVHRHGYDHSAHQAIISNPSISNTNGVAYPVGTSLPTNSILELIQALTRLLNTSVPSNAAQVSPTPLLQSFHDGSFSRAAMELSKHIKQKD